MGGLVLVVHARPDTACQRVLQSRVGGGNTRLGARAVGACVGAVEVKETLRVLKGRAVMGVPQQGAPFGVVVELRMMLGIQHVGQLGQKAYKPRQVYEV